MQTEQYAQQLSCISVMDNGYIYAFNKILQHGKTVDIIILRVSLVIVMVMVSGGYLSVPQGYPYEKCL